MLEQGIEETFNLIRQIMCLPSGKDLGRFFDKRHGPKIESLLLEEAREGDQ
jgi:hypothetical protein